MFIKREAAFQNNLNAQHEQSTHFQMHSKLPFQSLVINSKKKKYWNIERMWKTHRITAWSKVDEQWVKYIDMQRVKWKKEFSVLVG